MTKTLLGITPLATVNPTEHMKSNMEISDALRMELSEMEEWHFLSIQMRVFVFANLVIAFWTFTVFLLAVYSTDYNTLVGVYEKYDFITMFGFECARDARSRWWTERSKFSDMLFELHYVIMFMYSTIGIVVISTVPLAFDRLVLTEKEIEAEEAKKKKKEKKKLAKKLKKQAKNELGRQSVLMDFKAA